MENIEVRKTGENEYFLGINKISFIEGDTIHVEVIGDQTDEMAEKYDEVIGDLTRSYSGKINYLIDLNKSGKNASGAREKWKEMSMRERTGRVATFGLNPVARIISSFVVGSGKKGKWEFFKTKDEALKWIHEK